MAAPHHARRRRILRAIITSAVAIGAIALVWRALGRPVAWRSVQFQPVPIILAFAGALGFLLARAWRYHLLLPRHRPGAGQLVGMTAASWAIGLLVPGPSADASFVGMAKNSLDVGVARATGVSIVGRALDVVSLGVVAVLASLLSSGHEPRGAVVAAAVAGLIGAAGLVLMFSSGPRRLFLRQLARVDRARSWAERTDAALSDIGSPRRLTLLSASTALCRVSTAVEYVALFALIGFHLGFWQVWFVLAIRSFLTAIPIQGIAGIGTSQAWWTSALVLEGVMASDAVAASITLQVLDLAVALPLSAVVVALTTRRGYRRPATRRYTSAVSTAARDQV